MAVVTDPRRRSPATNEAASPWPRPDALMWALAAMIWTYVWRVQDLVPILGQFKVNLIASAATIGLIAMDRHPGRRLGWLRMPIVACALALAGVTILGIPTSLWPVRSISALMTELLPNLLLMIVLAASIRGARDLEWFALVYLVGACVYSLFIQATFDVGPAGRLAKLVYYDANDLALVLLCTVPFALYFLVRDGRRYRLVGAIGLVVFVATLVSTGSRGGFLGFVAILLYILLRYRVIPRRVRVVAVVAGFALFSVLASSAYWEQIRTLAAPTQDYNWSGRSPEGRLEVWRRGLGYISTRPLFGVGLRNFPLAEGMLSAESRARAERGRGFKWSVAHNSFLEVAVELGLTGFVAFIVMIAAAMRTAARLGATPLLGDMASRRQVAFASTISTAFVGFIVAGLFVSAAYYSALYVLLGLAAGCAKLERWSLLSTVDPRARGSTAGRIGNHMRWPRGPRPPLLRPGRSTHRVTTGARAND